MDMMDRVVVVTGGGSGIGEALAVAARQAGARHVVVADLHADQAERVAAAVDGTGIGLDVSDESAIRNLVEQTEEAHGPIDLFCSNAGFVTAAGLEESNEILNRMWDVHVMAHIFAARAVLPSMIARGEGYLLNTASAAGLLSQIGSVGYTITKHAAVALAEWLSITHHHQGIGVSVLCPQAVRTNILANSPNVENRAMGDDLDGGVAGADGVLEADDVAQMCLEAIAEQRFWVLPHPEVAEYVRRKGDDIERWLVGMRRFQSMLYPDGPLPGDAIAPTL
ncbi:MAG: SDR family NAD(P)-dependent oxidoreductase [Acidimicrobiia bacterium]|nr:SDR family NAD(P)-dependent oxidoreductase [Acidimicrobiia bacterium]MDH5519099.1 SDR family NAD(P)-dependent oxidoreductase [Acidimicrobiia bacterium]